MAEGSPPESEFIRPIYEAVLSIKMTLDQVLRSGGRSNDTETLMTMSIELERLRLKLRLILDLGRRKTGVSKLDIERTLHEVQGSLLVYSDNANVMSEIGNLRIITSRINPRSRQQPGQMTLFGEGEKGTTIGEGIRNIAKQIAILLSDNLSTSRNPDLRQLRAIVPDQKIAPMQFDFRDGRLVLVEPPSKVDREDVANVEAARAELLEAGDRLLGEVERSNCDRRLVESITYLQNKISSRSNIIQVGLCNMVCDIMCRQFEQELPEAILSMLRAQTFAVGMYVGQFPEWHRFVENAASAEISSENIEAIRATTDNLVEELSSKPDLIDPEIPRTFAQLRLLVRDPAVTSKRAFFAIVRSMENLISKVFSFAASFLEETAEGVKTRLSSAISKAIVVALLTVALRTAVDITPLTGTIGEMSWIRNAVDIVQHQIESLLK